MHGRFANSALLLLTVVFLPVGAQAPIPGHDPAHSLAIVLPLSQPGARGKLVSATQPAVPVPPGPVAPSKIKPAPPTPIAQRKIELGQDQPWDPEWDVLIEENLPPELLSSDVNRAVHPFCPRFSHLANTDKRSYWAYFFQALAGAEAGLRATASVRHSDPTVAVVDRITHRIARQEGLLQLAYMDADRYGCDFDWDADRQLPLNDPRRTILRPQNNLLCGIRILTNQLIALHQPLITSHSYWGTLHPGTLSFRVFARQMANVPVACVRPSDEYQSAKPQLREASNQPPADSPLSQR